MDEKQLAWNLLCELRKEILENQRSRASIRQSQFTLIAIIFAACIAAFYNNYSEITQSIIGEGKEFYIVSLYIFISVIFFIIVSLNCFSISYDINSNRIGKYIREEIENNILKKDNIKFIFWEKYIADNPIFVEPGNVNAIVQRFFSLSIYIVIWRISDLFFRDYMKYKELKVSFYQSAYAIVTRISYINVFLIAIDFSFVIYLLFFSRAYTVKDIKKIKKQDENK